MSAYLGVTSVLWIHHLGVNDGATLWTHNVREVAAAIPDPTRLFHSLSILLISFTYDLQFQLTSLYLRVYLLPQILPFLPSTARINHIYTGHLIDSFVELGGTVAIGRAEVAAGSIRELRAPTVALVTLPILCEMPW